MKKFINITLGMMTIFAVSLVNASDGKGIIAGNVDQGFKLSSEAEKNFDIQTMKVPALRIFEVPKSAVVTSGLEINLYRYRDGFYKRIDFEKIKKSGDSLFVRSNDLKNGDLIVITGLGFLRLAELAAFDDAPEDHSH